MFWLFQEQRMAVDLESVKGGVIIEPTLIIIVLALTLWGRQKVKEQQIKIWDLIETSNQ